MPKTLIMTILLLLATAAVAAQTGKRLTVAAGISRTARFEPLKVKQFSLSLTANYKLTTRWSFGFGITQPFQNKLFAVRAGLNFRIY